MDEERPAVRDVEHGAVGIGASADASPAQTSFHILVDGLAFLSKVGGREIPCQADSDISIASPKTAGAALFALGTAAFSQRYPSV